MSLTYEGSPQHEATTVYTLPGVQIEEGPLQPAKAAAASAAERGPLDGLAWTWNALAILALTFAVIGVLGAAFSFTTRDAGGLSFGVLLAIGGGIAGLTFRTISALLYVVARRID